ncbi:PREDICTED: zonadhesin, partial [Rhagoletis zephyria]|uniref:zonadhesin n=1 Tax=Rhagoletis zephyria TaxID=28612 RepID=UPI0008114C6F
MRRNLRTLLLFCSLWHAILCVELNTTVAQVKLLPADIQDLQIKANASAAQLLSMAVDDGEDTDIIEAAEETAVLETHSPPDQSRSRRQLFYDPSLLMLTNFGAEGSKCISSRGYSGICVRFTVCQPLFRYNRQINFFALRQWPQVPRVGQEICSFYDQFGHPNTGICCTNTFMGNGMGGAGMLPPFIYPGGVNPLLTPPTVPTAPTQEIPQVGEEEELEEEKDEEDIIELDHPTEIDPLVDPLHVPSTGGGKPEFQAENNVVYDPIKEDGDEKPESATRAPATTYNEFAYQWPGQFGNQFSGVHQWPPPLPTHPPTTGVWPPPLPTHPPNHHYPTHSSVTTRPTTQTTTRRTTTRLTTTTPRPTTTTSRRPSYPSYPSYPA